VPVSFFPINGSLLSWNHTISRNGTFLASPKRQLGFPGDYPSAAVLSSRQTATDAETNNMRIKQADFRTIQIEKRSFSYRLRYSLYQGGDIRYPESITCRGDTVVAYFLTSTIRDFISETAHGFCIERHWTIVPEGIFGLSFYLEIPCDPGTAYLFPGVQAGRSVPACIEPVAGERTCYPNGLFLFTKPDAVLIFSDPPISNNEAGSIAVLRPREEETDSVRIEIRIPSAATSSNKVHFFRSDGGLEYNLRLNLVTAPENRIHPLGVGAVLERNKRRLHRPPQLSSEAIHKIIDDQIEECLKIFLVDRGPLCGLLETAGEPKLSALAGCTLALIQLRSRPKDKDAVELSLRLADFALKGQHPRGLFYPYYRRDRKSWLPRDPAITVSLQESAEIALMLLRFSDTLRSRQLPGSIYLHAASHMADALLQANPDPMDHGDTLYSDSLLPAGPAAVPPALAELFLELHRVTGKDRYRKAARTLGIGYFTQQPEPLSLPGSDERTADLDAVITRARAALSLHDSGIPIKGLSRYLDALLSRIYLNSPDSYSELNPYGAIKDPLGNPTLVFRGFEAAHTLLALNACLSKSSRLEELDLLVAQLLGFTRQKPPGTTYFDPYQKPGSRFGVPSSSMWVKELFYIGRLSEEFPDVFRG
jgi:hypothetical protein